MIQDFFSAKKIAVAGASRNEKKFGNIVCHELKSKGFDIFPVNPSGEVICNEVSYTDVSTLPPDVKHLIIVTRKDQTKDVVENAIKKGIQNVWIQQKSDTPEAIKIAQDAGLKLVWGKCLFMYVEPVKGFHKFHRGMYKMFGRFKP